MKKKKISQRFINNKCVEERKSDKYLLFSSNFRFAPIFRKMSLFQTETNTDKNRVAQMNLYLSGR